jgi:DNA-binding YbaB/EbfC family protein
MSENPFDALGGGGFDVNALMQQAQQMQEQLEQAQQRLQEQRITGEVAGGAVRVSVTGTGELVSVDVRPGTVDGDDEDSLTEMGDLVVAAYRDAKARADQAAQEALGPLAGGGLPGLG